MIAGYAQFAATGDPSGRPDDVWPLYVPDAERHVRFEDSLVIADQVSENCDFWDALSAG
jgi:hypothetical protein